MGIKTKNLKKGNNMSKIQCPECKQCFQRELLVTRYSDKIPNHVCMNNEPIRSEDDQDNIAGEINNINYAINVFSSDDSPNMANDISSDYSSVDTSSSDIGGGGDFGGGGTSSDW